MMLRHCNIIPMLAAVLSLAGAASAQTISRPVEPAGGGTGSDIVVVQFYSGGHLDNRAAGLAIVDAGGEAIAHRVLGHHPRGQTTIAVDARGHPQGLVLQYSSKPISTAKPNDDLPVSLVMRTYASDRSSIGAVNELLRTLDRTAPLGVALVDRVNFAHNPFGADTRFITDIQGLLNIRESGRYRFFSVNDDAAAVLINGNVVIQHDKKHVVRDHAQLAQQAVGIDLSAGVHRVRYVHIQRQKQSIALLGHMAGKYGTALGAHMFVHHRQGRLGPATSDTDAAPTGFDAQQIDHLAHENYLFTRFRLAAIAQAPPPSGHLYRWQFGDGSTRADTTGKPFEHVFVRLADQSSNDTDWGVTVQLLNEAGQAVGSASGALRPVVFGDYPSIGDRRRLLAYARAIGDVQYDQAKQHLLSALYALVSVTEQPALIAPVAEPIVRRYGDGGGQVIGEMKYTLATHLAQDDPQRAAKLFGEIARARGDGWRRARAAVEQLDLLIYRLDQTQGLTKHVAPLLATASSREQALLKSKLGDALRAAGDVAGATKAYQQAQQLSFRQLEPRRAAVLQTAHRETALGHLRQNRLPALREALFQWEADFPADKLGGDLPLLTGRYFQAVGDDARAVLEYHTILKINPNHTSKPEIVYRLAQSLARAGRQAEAQEQYVQLVRDFPNSPFAQRPLGQGR